MASVFNGALAVKELEPGEWHWFLLKEAAQPESSTSRAEDLDEQLRYSPHACSDPHSDAAAAWAAGYLAIRATIRRAVRS